MAESAYVPRLAVHPSDRANSPREYAARHPAIVRITHWLNAISFAGLLVSGFAILLAHPRLYWGETGAVGMPSLLDLPLPFVLTGQTGWGRSLHLLSAWACVLTGAIYIANGLIRRRFLNGFSSAYEAPQRLTYFAVVFLLFPLIIWTGLAMSPAVTSVFPVIVNVFGGHQSARTIHFIAASLLVIFLVAHIAIVTVSGFTSNVRGMILGRATEPKRGNL